MSFPTTSWQGSYAPGTTFSKERRKPQYYGKSSRSRSRSRGLKRPGPQSLAALQDVIRGQQVSPKQWTQEEANRCLSEVSSGNRWLALLHCLHKEGQWAPGGLAPTAQEASPVERASAILCNEGMCKTENEALLLALKMYSQLWSQLATAISNGSIGQQEAKVVVDTFNQRPELLADWMAGQFRASPGFGAERKGMAGTGGGVSSSYAAMPPQNFPAAVSPMQSGYFSVAPSSSSSSSAAPLRSRSQSQSQSRAAPQMQTFRRRPPAGGVYPVGGQGITSAQRLGLEASLSRAQQQPLQPLQPLQPQPQQPQQPQQLQPISNLPLYGPAPLSAVAEGAEEEAAEGF